VLVNQYRQKENLHLWYWYRLVPHPVAPPPSSNGWYSVLATDVIAIPPSAPETVYSVLDGRVVCKLLTTGICQSIIQTIWKFTLLFVT
jgi:TRAP-type C4-dicarboxylate transport system permease large subunit